MAFGRDFGSIGALHGVRYPPSVHSSMSIFSLAQMNHNELKPPRERFVYFDNFFRFAVLPHAFVSCRRTCAAESCLMLLTTYQLEAFGLV